MTINTVRNNRYGPGGSARRLHQIFLSILKDIHWGRNRIDVRGKGSAFVRHGIHRYRAKQRNANDNEAFAVAA